MLLDRRIGRKRERRAGRLLFAADDGAHGVAVRLSQIGRAIDEVGGRGERRRVELDGLPSPVVR